MGPFGRTYVRISLWAKSFVERMKGEENREDRERVILAAIGFPLFFLIGAALSIVVGVGGALIWMGLGHTMTAEFMNFLILVTFVVTEFAYPLLLLAPVVRRIVRTNGGTGFSTKDMDKRMRPRVTGRLSAAIGKAAAKLLPERVRATKAYAWAKAIVIGLLTGTGLFWGLQLVSNLVPKDLIPTDQATNDTTLIITNTARYLFAGESKWPFLAALVVFCTCCVGPFVEELLFRGVVGRSLMRSTVGTGPADENGETHPSRLRIALCCLAIGAIFSLAHFATFPNAFVAVLTLGTTLAIGTIFAWIACRKYDSTWPTAIAHMTYNTWTLVAVLALGMA